MIAAHTNVERYKCVSLLVHLLMNVDPAPSSIIIKLPCKINKRIESRLHIKFGYNWHTFFPVKSHIKRSVLK
jgi:hypothetical protein